MPEGFIEKIREAGVVGAGGAGFPTHVKLNTQAEIVIANCAECEPLLQVDQQAADLFTDKLLDGLEAAVQHTGANRGVIAVKKKHCELVKKLEAGIRSREKLDILLLENFYPAGDEHVLVHLVTNRIVPEGGIPLNVHVVVNNVNTLIHVADAQRSIPVTGRMLTVTGEVKNPVTLILPIGTSLQEAITLTGGPLVADFRVIVGGPMMGFVEDDLEKPVTKTTSGILVLPSDHKLIRMKTRDMRISINRARSICCQCSYCTEMCPRRLLGHDLEPHKIIRSTAAGLVQDSDDLTSAFLCSECGLCGYYSCIHEIMPFKVNGYLKKELTRNGIRNTHRRSDLNASDMLEYRRVPVERLMEKLHLGKYNQKAPFRDIGYTPRKVSIPLKQHAGAPARPIVAPGETVKRGQKIAGMEECELGASIHASIEGKVTAINVNIVIEANE